MTRCVRDVLVMLGVAGVLAAPAWASGSRDFDGVDDRITISDVSIMQGGKAASYAVWVKADRLPSCPWGTYSLVRKDGEFNLQLMCNGSSPQGFNGAIWGNALGTNYFCPYTLTTGTWHHIVVRWDKTVNTGDTEILVDGTLVCTIDGNDTSNLANSSNALMFGNNEAYSEDFDGRMAHVRVFNKRLSDAEVAQEQNSPGSVSGLVGYWKLSGLSPEPDSSGNNSSTAIAGTTVSTDGPPIAGSDTTAPTVSITAPTGGTTVSGTITVSANASDNVGVSGVQFKLDGANLGAEDTTSPYSTSWNTTTATNGGHSLIAVARDAAGNATTSSAVSVTVNNTAADTTPPTGSITINGGAAATKVTAVTLTLSASDASGVSQMQCSNDNVSYSTAEAYATSKSWTISSGDGTKTVYVKYKDAVGNWSGAFTDTITLDTVAPGITITSPADGTVVTP